MSYNIGNRTVSPIILFYHLQHFALPDVKQSHNTFTTTTTTTATTKIYTITTTKTTTNYYKKSEQRSQNSRKPIAVPVRR